MSQLAAFNHDHSMTGNGASPFDLDNESAYLRWRAEKLRLQSELSATRVFDVLDDPIDPVSLAGMKDQLDGFGFFIWQSPEIFNEARLLAFNRRFGLQRIDANIGAGEDAVTRLQVVSPDDHRSRYIPYSDRRLNWHTDGYYNAAGQRIRSFCLYCANPAAEGGDNFLYDHEMLYLRLRDQDPRLIAALMANDALLIPANTSQGSLIRKEEQGPVFSPGLSGCRLHMRYSARPGNIAWKQQPELQSALQLIREILSEPACGVILRLQQGQGILTNNILHGRLAFTDGEHPRLMYRARYYDEISFETTTEAGECRLPS